HLVRVGRGDQEVVGRLFDVGQFLGEGPGDEGQLIIGHPGAQRLRVTGAPAHHRNDAVVDVAAVEVLGLRNLVGVVVDVRVDLPAVDAAVLVDVVDVGAQTLTVGGSDVAGGAGLVHDGPDADRLVRIG